MALRIFAVGSADTPTRLVRAKNSSVALRHVVGDTFGVGVPDQETLVALVQQGVQVEDIPDTQAGETSAGEAAAG